MAKRNRRKITPEDRERFERTQAMVRERIAYHDAKAREEDERRGVKREPLQLSADRHERFEQIQAMVRERIAYHEAKAREEDERRAAGGTQ